jgi:hypothetical protein
MNDKERIDYLLTRVPEGKKDAFVEDLKGVSGLEEGLSVLKKYGITLTEEEMQKLSSKCEMSGEELDAAAGGCECCCKSDDCEINTPDPHP